MGCSSLKKEQATKIMEHKFDQYRNKNKIIRGGWCGIHYKYIYLYWIVDDEMIVSRKYQWGSGKDSVPPSVFLVKLDAEFEEIQKRLSDSVGFDGTFIVPGPTGYIAEWSLNDGKIISQKYYPPNANITRSLDRWISSAIKKGNRLNTLPSILEYITSKGSLP